LTTASSNPSVPGAIHLTNDQSLSGNTGDPWQAQLQRVVAALTGGDLDRPIVTFASNINRWQSRNLALRLIALGYRHV
jgi:hypothetical protein